MQILVEVEGESVTLLPSRQEELMLITASLTSVENLLEHGKCTCVAPAFSTQIKTKLTKSIAKPTTGAHMVLSIRFEAQNVRNRYQYLDSS